MIKINKTIIYLHGFGSTGESDKAISIKQNLGKDFEILTPTLSTKPNKAIEEIRNLLSESNKSYILVGTSLGGFYADYFSKLTDTPALLINPLVDIEDIKQFIGLNENFKTGKSFHFTENDYKYLQQINKQKTHIVDNAPKIILLAKDDNLLDYKKSLTYFNDSNHYFSIFNEGSHRFNKNEIVKDYILKLTEFMNDYN